MNHGGIRIRSAAHFAPSVFLASADGSSALISCTYSLTLRFSEVLYPEIGVALSLWGNDQRQSPPQPPFSHLQKSWDIPCILARAESLLQNASDPKTRVHLLAVSTHELGAWLNAIYIYLSLHSILLFSNM